MGALAHDRSQPIMRLPVDRVLVTLVIETGETLSGEIFLAPGEEASSVLAEAEPFVPVALDKGVRLVSRATISVLTVPGELGGDPDVAEDTQKAIVRLKSGASVEGLLRWAAVAGYRRTVDHLNLPARFLVVHGVGATSYINKTHVAWVEEC